MCLIIITIIGVFSPDVAKAAIRKGAEFGLASQMNTSCDIFDEDFDDMTADYNINRTNSNTDSNENNNKSNITGSSSTNTSGTKTRYDSARRISTPFLTLFVDVLECI
jgi:hypothetical protein